MSSVTAMTQAPPSTLHRFCGIFIDTLFVGFLASMVTLALTFTPWLDSTSSQQPRSSNFFSIAPPDQIVNGVAAIILWLAFRIVMEVNYGGSWGKDVISAKVTMLDGSPVTYKASFIRNCWPLLSMVGIFSEYLGNVFLYPVAIAIGISIYRNPGRRSFLDKLAGTVIVNKAE